MSGFDFSGFLRGSNEIGEAWNRGVAQRREDDVQRLKYRQSVEQAERERASQAQIAQATEAGDYERAAAYAYAAGNDKVGGGFAGLGKQRYDRAAAIAPNMGQIVASVASLPYEQRRAAIQSAKPMLVQMGHNAVDIDAFDPSDDNIRALGAIDYGVKDQIGQRIDQQNADTTRYGAETDRIKAEQPVAVGGSLVTRDGTLLYRDPQYITAPITSNLIEVPGAQTSGAVSAEDLYYGAIRPQESGGLPNGGAGAIGPVTRYGQAQGSSQMLPATAQAMARKVGIDWRPDLMTAKTQEGLAYQDRLGIEYTKEALQWAGGDVRKAAMYYHGGPDTSIHGPRTNRYADEVSARYARQRGQTTPQSAQPRVIQQGQAAPQTAAQAAKSAQQRASLESATVATEFLVRELDGLLTHPGMGAAVGVPNPLRGGFGSLGAVPGSPAADFGAKLAEVKAKIFVPAVQALRGMGALSNAEGAKLEAAAGALDPNMSEAQFKASIEQMKRDYRHLMDIARREAGLTGGGGQGLRVSRRHAEMLRGNPGQAAAFDARYGAGAAARVLGGR